MARTAEDEQHRTTFLQMARVWFALAHKDETNTDRMAIRETRSANTGLSCSFVSLFGSKLRPNRCLSCGLRLS